MLFIDLDDFKTINDSLGHGAGDALLQSVAARIDPLVRPTDTAARLGGDEFAVLLDGVANAHEAQGIAARMLGALAERFILEDRELRLTASIGIALSDDSMQADDLLRNADTAMYAAKASGKNTVQAFQPTMHRSAVERFELRTELPAHSSAKSSIWTTSRSSRWRPSASWASRRLYAGNTPPEVA